MNKYHLLALACVSVCAMNAMEEQAVTKKWDAEKYKNNSELQYKAAMRALSTIELKGDERVLDIGCGDGRVTANIANKVPQGFVEGIDIAPKMIEHARMNHTQDNLSFAVKDVSKSRYPYELVEQFKSIHRYNLVTAFSSLSWIKDQQQALTNIATLLVPNNGKLVAGVPSDDSPYLRARLGMHTHDTWKEFFVDYEIPYHPFSEEKIKTFLNIAGLRPVTIKKGGAPHLFASKEEFINWMRAVPVQIERIPQERHEEFWNDIVTEYLKEVPQKEDGSIELTIAALFVVAERIIDFSWL